MEHVGRTGRELTATWDDVTERRLNGDLGRAVELDDAKGRVLAAVVAESRGVRGPRGHAAAVAASALVGETAMFAGREIEHVDARLDGAGDPVEGEPPAIG